MQLSLSLINLFHTAILWIYINLLARALPFLRVHPPRRVKHVHWDDVAQICPSTNLSPLGDREGSEFDREDPGEGPSRLERGRRRERDPSQNDREEQGKFDISEADTLSTASTNDGAYDADEESVDYAVNYEQPVSRRLRLANALARVETHLLIHGSLSYVTDWELLVISETVDEELGRNKREE